MSPPLKRITVGISSFNEELNISRLLHSIIQLNKLESHDLKNQNNSDDKDYGSLRSENTREKSFEIAEVIISDDSSDNTCHIVDEIAAQNPASNVKLIHHDSRRGVS